MKWEHCVTAENSALEDALKLEKELITRQSVRKGPLYKIKDDPRKTRVGRFIEKYSLDELPQFFNVLFGSMLVGPRPHQEREVEKYMDYHRRLLTIKPGVTGMAQVAGRSDLDFEDEYKLDLYYIENWSLWLDTQICFKTAAFCSAKGKTAANLLFYYGNCRNFHFVCGKPQISRISDFVFDRPSALAKRSAISGLTALAPL